MLYPFRFVTHGKGMIFNMKILTNELISTGKYLMNNKLAWGSSGNISARVDNMSYLVTASGTFMDNLIEDDFVQVGLRGREILSNKKPTKETPMHSAIYEVRPDINAVLHSSPFYSMMLACSNEEINSDYFIESMYYLERIGYVEFHEPGSQDLGDQIKEEAEKTNIIFLQNHGVLVYDTSLNEARMALETLELACKMHILSKSSGIALTSVEESKVISFLDKGAYKPKRTW